MTKFFFGINEVLKSRASGRIIPEHFEIPFSENDLKSSNPKSQQELKIMSLLSLNLLEKAEKEIDLLNSTYGKSVHGEVLYAALSWLKGEMTPHDFLKNDGKFSSFESEKIHKYFNKLKAQSLNASDNGEEFFRRNLDHLRMRFKGSEKSIEPEVVKLIHAVTVLSMSLGSDEVQSNWMYYHSLASKISGYNEILPDPLRITLDKEQVFSPEVLKLIGVDSSDIKLSTTYFNTEDMECSELASLRPIHYEVEPNKYIDSEKFWLLMVEFKGSSGMVFNLAEGVGKLMAESLITYCKQDDGFSFRDRYKIYFGDLYEKAVTHRKSLYEKSQNPEKEILLPDRVIEGLYIVEQIIKGNYDLNHLGKFGSWIDHDDIREYLIPLCAWYALDLHDTDLISAYENDYRNGVLKKRPSPGNKITIPDQF